MTDITEENLQEALDLIAGRGKWAALGPGLHTYPLGDSNNERLHRICLELERRGKIRRQSIDGAIVLWRPA